MKDINRLAERVQRHRHSHTCYKHYKPGEQRSCRFNLKEENFRPESCINPETGEICLRCLDGLVNNFNMTILEAVRCNMDIQFIGSGESAKAMIYYITDYITKSQLKSHVAYTALQLAVKKTEELPNDDDFTTHSKRLLQKCAYALISHQEMSAQQVASYLMGYEDHFTSDRFNVLYWASFERYVERYDVEKLFPKHHDDGVDVDDESTSTASDHASLGIGDDEHPTNDHCTDESLDSEEEVSIRVDSGGNVMALADQVADYTMRPTEVHECCLWDFVAKTEKVYTRRSTQHVDDIEQVVENESDTGDELEDQSGEDGEQIMNVPRPGPKPSQKYSFLPGHKDGENKRLRIREQIVVPVPIGPALPRRDQTDVRARYCRLMLILFKPWRTVADLRALPVSWETSFDVFVQTINEHHKQVLDNMQILHECRDSRNNHMQTRSRLRSTGSIDESMGNAPPGNEVEDVDMTDVLEHLQDIDRMSSRKNEQLAGDTQDCLESLDSAGFFSAFPHASEMTHQLMGDDEMLVNGDDLEDQWRDTYDKRKAAWKLQTRDSDGNEPEPSTTINCTENLEPSLQDAQIVNAAIGEGGTSIPNPEDVIEGITAKWTLNREQHRAFSIVAHHTLKEKPEQLLMYLGGPGGTGKSRVVNALWDFFQSRNQNRRFRLVAYTGVAAQNIGGATLHALLQMNESGREMSVKTKRELSAMWDGVDYLFIDELSMLGCELLHNISRALTEAKGNTAAFGGVNIILAGDFAQLPPIGDTRLYKDVNTTAFAAGATNRGQGKILGRLLWLSFQIVVILHESM